jgi:long-chain acyl-CoA synthetase
VHPSIHAVDTPDKAAYIMAADGREVSYGELNERSNRLAHVFRVAGLRWGDTIAVLLENNVSFFPIVWAAQRAGLTYACLSSALSPGDLAFIVRDSGSKVVIVSGQTAPLLERAKPELAGLRCFQIGGATSGNEDLDAAAAHAPATPIADEASGNDMLYSSGTTGRPKGVRRPIAPNTPIDQAPPIATIAAKAYGLGGDTVYLSPAPLYHAGPLRWAMAVQRLGGTVVVMDKFDAEGALGLIERYQVTAAQWVPTHFIRLLHLPRDVRGRYDISSLRTAFHAAAPCPVNVKERMLDWWGPIIHEYYGGTENNGITIISPEEWLTHRGSVGRAVIGEIKICGPDGEPLGSRCEGGVYFAGGDGFEYHNDPAKTQASRNQHGWTTLGDVGWIDEEGYLYLTDRKHFMIISGGVNIYPQEIENVLIGHPAVADVAVIGAPDEDMGEKVVAVVEPMEWAEAGDALAAELRAFARARLGGVKTPRQVDFMRELPRQATGKLFKRLLRDAYWPAG